MLELLRSRPGSLFTRDTVIAALPGDFEDRAIDVYVRRARQALEDQPCSIETVRGFGLIFHNHTSQA